LVYHENPLLVITFPLSLVEMHLYAFIAIFVPKLVAMVTPLCPMYGRITDKFPDGTNPISK